jgi:signal transduction histidine kinase
VSSQRANLAASFGEALACVLYECNASLELTYVSENISELLDLESSELIGSRLLSDERIPREDLIQVSNRLGEIEHLEGMISLVHRILDRRGLPVWVIHNLRKISSNDTAHIRGCIVPMGSDVRLNSTEQAVISRFVHKIGNHFQLLNLVINSLKRTLPESRETAMLQETVEKAIELTRSFSDYNQGPTCLSQIELIDILEAAVMTRRSLFETKGVAFESQIEPSVTGTILKGDPYLLDLAIGHVLQNALEATDPGAEVTLQARAEYSKDVAPVARISVKDSGCGIAVNSLASASIPFFTSKKNHDGLGLSMASRFIEMHGGLLRIRSVEGKGTEVEILLPIEPNEQSSLL